MDINSNNSSNGSQHHDNELLKKVDQNIQTLSTCKKADTAKNMDELAKSICEYLGWLAML